jgi:hypothetical protein
LARVSARVLGNSTGLALVCDSAMALGARWARESAESWVAMAGVGGVGTGVGKGVGGGVGGGYASRHAPAQAPAPA